MLGDNIYEDGDPAEVDAKVFDPFAPVLDGQTQLLVTGAAAKLRPTGRNEFTEVAWSAHNFVDLAVYPNRIQGEAVDHQGQVIDTFTTPGP